MQQSKILLLKFAFLLCSLPALAQGGGNITVSGVVTSAEDKAPLVGVHVLSGSTSGVSTLGDGSYSIVVTPGTVLSYHYIGFKVAEFTVPEGTAKLTHNVELQPEAQALDDVVVIAYGVRKKGTITGSVSTVKAEKVESTPTAAFDQALQGQVPGLTVMSNTGEPSVAATFTIRGTNSINSGTAPLYILDGIPISSSDFNAINPSDIESISVLKDASSTSIYGSRASNGVVVITTKRGRMAEKPIISYRMQLGFSQIAKGNWDLMNTEERIQYEKEIGLTDGKDYNLLSQTDVCWLDEVYNNAAMLQNYELSVSGANEKTNYYVSGGYYSQEGIALGSNFDRYSIRANIEQRAAKWLKIGTNTMLNYQDIEQADDGEYTLVTPISAARFMLPYWNPYNPDGSLASVNDGSWKGDGQNPLEWIKNNQRSYKKYKLVSSIFAEATIIEGLTFKSQFNVDFSHMTGLSTSAPSYAPNLGQGNAQRLSSDALTLSVTNTLNYQFQKDKHSFNFLLGQEGVNYHYEGFTLRAEGQNNDKLVNITSGTRVTSWSDTTDDDYSYMSVFGRGEYNYDLVSGGLNYYGDAGMAPSQPGNEDLGWEKLWTTNLGFHFGFWNRLNVDFELYNKRTSDMLMEVPQSYADKGYGYYWDNIGVMVNRGAEVNLSGTVVATKDFAWSLNANFSYNKNKILELYNGVQEYEMSATSMKLVVGHDSGEFYVNRFAGVNPANGDALWYTKDGEITTEMRDEDKVLVGKSMNAPWAGGFGTNLSWKGISLSAQFSWVADRWMINNDRYFDESNGRYSAYNQSRKLFDRWKKPGDITDIPRHGVYTEFDDRLLEDASFLRLKNLMLSYSFPQELLRKTRFINGIRIYAQAQNLFTFTKFSGLDPEGIGNMYQAQYPMSRQFTFGLDLTF